MLYHTSAIPKIIRDNRDRYRMVVGFLTTYAISVYHQLRCEFKSCSWRGVLDTTLCDKVCQVNDFLELLRSPPPIKLTATL